MKLNKKITDWIFVVIILVLLGLVIVPIVNKALKNSNQRLYSIQVRMIEKRAEKWGIDNIDKLSETKIIYLTLGQLINEGYVSETELSDPRNTSNLLNGCILIEYDGSYKKYNYNYNEKECSELKP